MKIYVDVGTHKVPVAAKRIVCERCGGEGTILNPSIGEHAYSREEFEEAFPEPEDQEQYFRRGGIYDVVCPECRGRNVTDVIDWDWLMDNTKLTKIRMRVRIQNEERSEAEYEAECRMERMMGC